MSLIDTHAHLTYPGLVERIDEVLTRCAEAGVERVITIGTDAEEICAALRLAERYPDRVFASAGFHPHEAAKIADPDWTVLREALAHPAVIGFGEMGLDYHYDFAPRDVQQRVFRRQLDLASEFGLPIIIHCREAFDDLRPILLSAGFEGRRVVFHCFTGTPEEAAAIAGHGWRVSFTGIVTFKGSTQLQAIARSYPADQLMIETDSPYLSPVPVRGVKPNEPAHVAHVARFLAELRGEPYDVLARRTWESSLAFFRREG